MHCISIALQDTYSTSNIAKHALLTAFAPPQTHAHPAYLATPCITTHASSAHNPLGYMARVLAAAPELQAPSYPALTALLYLIITRFCIRGDAY